MWVAWSEYLCFIKYSLDVVLVEEFQPTFCFGHVVQVSEPEEAATATAH